MTAIFSLFVGIAFAIAGTVWGVMRFVKKAKEDAVSAEKTREEEVQKRIKDALLEQNDILQRERDIATQWKELATVRESRIEDMVIHIAQISAELKTLKENYAALTKQYLESQTKLSELERRLDGKQ